MPAFRLDGRSVLEGFRKRGWSVLGAAVAGSFVASASSTSAGAASAVTFVSGLGRDRGACTRDAPCRRFRYAITQTTRGGTIAALDRAGFGAVTITQSVTILGLGKGGAGMSPIERTNGNTGIDIEAPGGTIVLRGLEIDGGYNGINIGQAANVLISDTVITGSSNLAINASAAGATVLVQDTTTLNALTYANAATFVAKRVTASGSGIFSLGGHVVLDDCTISGASTDAAVYGGTTLYKHDVLASASGRGISGESGGTIFLDTTTTFGSGVGIDTVGPTFSYGNNNFPDGTGGTITPIAGD